MELMYHVVLIATSDLGSAFDQRLGPMLRSVSVPSFSLSLSLSLAFMLLCLPVFPFCVALLLNWDWEVSWRLLIG